MRITLTLFLMLWLLGAMAQDTPILRISGELSPITVPIDELAWIAGEWVGEEGDTRMEEYWFPPMANAMMGCFRMRMKGEIVFYEFMQIRTTAEHTELQIKHFSNDLIGWEEAGESERFELLRSEPGLACFDGLSFRLIDEDQLMIVVVMGRGGDEEKVGEFLYRRQ